MEINPIPAEPRLQRRYDALVMAHLAPSQRVAAGIHLPPSLAQSFAATQAAWRFYRNPRLNLEQLAQPLMAAAQADVPESCQQWVLIAMDWSNLHFQHHEGKEDRVSLSRKRNLGYELLSVLAMSDRAGEPIAPLSLDLRAADGVHSTRSPERLREISALDNLLPIMQHVQRLALGKTPVFLIDREADSVGHYRQWEAKGFLFVVRAEEQPQVFYEGQEQSLGHVADELKRRNGFCPVGAVSIQGQSAVQYVAEVNVVLTRPACPQRVDRHRKKKRKRIKGMPLPLRLVVSEVRDKRGKVLARWLLLTNVPSRIPAAQVALWYYWRWRIESYHKLLKGAGQQVECWQQEGAEAVARRLVVAAMALVVVWRLARDQSPEAGEMQQLLIRLSGRQMKRGKKARGLTEPALLAGLGVLIPMLELMNLYRVEDLRQLAQVTLPASLPALQASSVPRQISPSG